MVFVKDMSVGSRFRIVDDHPDVFVRMAGQECAGFFPCRYVEVSPDSAKQGIEAGDQSDVHGELDVETVAS